MASNNNNALLKKPVVGAPLNKPLPPKPKQEVNDQIIKTNIKFKVSLSAFSFLFSEFIQYTQVRLNNIAEIEKR